MAGPDTQRQRSNRSKPKKYRIFGIKINQYELMIVSCCIVFIFIAAIGIILNGHSRPTEDDEGKTPANEDNTEPAAKPLHLSQASVLLNVGDSVTLSASGGAETVEWTSSDESVATVEGGVITGVAIGDAVITAASGEESAVCTVSVSAPPPLSSVELYLNHSDFTMRVNDPAVQMRVKVKETKAVYEGAVTWESADRQVVTISETGLVERVGKGTTTITAYVDGQALECIVRVR